MKIENPAPTNDVEATIKTTPNTNISRVPTNKSIMIGNAIGKATGKTIKAASINYTDDILFFYWLCI